MKKSISTNKFVRACQFLYLKVIRINDSPHKVALGIGLGVFTGIMPGMGVIVALLLAVLLRANRAAALAGSLLTNTWLSLVTFLLSINIGSVIMMREPDVAAARCKEILQHFHWKDIFQVSILDVLLPLVVGFAVIAIVSGLVVYVIARLILIERGKNKWQCS